MPPPNVTAALHMGHGLNNTVQDVLVRFERMRGRRALWLPGTDHAGIATQNVVERLLAKEGLTRFDVGREAFVERVWSYVEETGAAILEQLKAIGCSRRLGPHLLHAGRGPLARGARGVRAPATRRDSIYRGHYIINWCPRCLTALSNEEAEKEETDGKIWHLATPRRRERPRHRGHHASGDDAGGHGRGRAPRGRALPRPDRPRLRLPLVDRLMPIVADEAVDPAFGSGAVKVTPAHDPADFEIGRRHGLPAHRRHDARGADQPRGAGPVPGPRPLRRTEPRRGGIRGGRPARQGRAPPPRGGALLSLRHRGRAAALRSVVRPHGAAGPSRARGVSRRDPPLHPRARGDDYAQWLEGIRDWCISRQLWWGHRIPVWYCERRAAASITVSRTDVGACLPAAARCGRTRTCWTPGSPRGSCRSRASAGPTATPDLAAFYPGHTLVTAPEIIFFWVARMIMSGLYFMGEVPYTHMYLHGTVRDTQHRKMSKSLGNGIDPLEVVERYGADALRYSIVSGMSVGTDVILDPDDLEGSFAAGRNFANKLWNAGRFILSNLDRPPRPLAGSPGAVRRDELTLADRWIIARCDATVREATEAYEKFRLNDAAARRLPLPLERSGRLVHRAGQAPPLWRCAGRRRRPSCGAQTFDVALRLLHPVMPFMTEALWRRFPGRPHEASISVAPWPRPDVRAPGSPPPSWSSAWCRRWWAPSAASAPNTASSRDRPCARSSARTAAAREGHRARARHDRAPREALRARLGESRARGGPRGPPDGTAVFVPLGEAIDVGRECGRLGAEAERLAALVASQEKKLSNQQFVSRAPADVVAREREKLVAWTEQKQVLTRKRELLGCG